MSEGTGDPAHAAKLLGLAPKTVRNWAVDDYGNVCSRRVLDAAIAAMVRSHVARLRAGQEPLEVSQRDLLALVDLSGVGND